VADSHIPDTPSPGDGESGGERSRDPGFRIWLIGNGIATVVARWEKAFDRQQADAVLNGKVMK